MNKDNITGFRCHDADACAMGQNPCPTPFICGCAAPECSVKEGTHKPAEAVHQIQDPVVNQHLMSEREAFEKWLGIKPCGAAHDFGWAAWKARAALAATPAAAPVVLPEPDAKSNGAMIVWSRSKGVPPIDADLYTAESVRALLATGGQAQAVEGSEA